MVELLVVGVVLLLALGGIYLLIRADEANRKKELQAQARMRLDPILPMRRPLVRRRLTTPARSSDTTRSAASNSPANFIAVDPFLSSYSDFTPISPSSVPHSSGFEGGSGSFGGGGASASYDSGSSGGDSGGGGDCGGGGGGCD